MTTTRRLKTLLALITTAWLAPPAAAQGGPPPANVVIDQAKTMQVMLQREVVGDIRSMRRALVAGAIEGLIIELPLRAGDLVEQGQLIAKLDDDLARAEADQARAGIGAADGLVAQRTAEVDLANRELGRAQQLDRSGSLSAGELDRFATDVAIAEAELAQAKSDLAAARATLARAEKNLADKTILAPFTGRVVRRSAEVGEWISPGDAILELVSVADLEAWVDVPEHLVRFIDRPGASVPITVPGLGRSSDAIEATIIAVVPDADRLSRMFPVRLAVPSEGGILKPGMSLKATVPTGERRERLTIHKDAILRDDAGEFVYMSVPAGGSDNPAVNGQAMPARVRTVFAFGDRVVIEPGQIREGSILITEGNERVFPTQPLIYLNPPAEAAAANGEPRAQAPQTGDR